MMKSKYTHTLKDPDNQSGVTLIEALIALLILVAGTAAIFGIHGQVAATNTMNRMELIATSLVQEKLEELRVLDYTLLSDTDNQVIHKDPTIAVQIPGMMQNRTFDLTRCWSVEEVDEDLNDSMIRVQVAILNGDLACDSDSFTSLNLLTEMTTLIARHDPRAAAQNLAEQAALDGDGELIDGEPPEDYEAGGSTPGGFEIFTSPDGETVIYNPDTNQYLQGRDGGPLLYAQVNGNILIDDANFTPALLSKLFVKAEGAATCRRFYPGSELEDGIFADEDIPYISGQNHKIFYVQYSCIVANNWRRSVYLDLPRFNQELEEPTEYAACVGQPDLQPPTGPDLLVSLGRQYTGFKWDDPNSPNRIRVPVGMRGTADGSAIIGTICQAGDDCWENNDDPNSANPNLVEIRGWVPGGHHYFVKQGGVDCATAMRRVLEIDCDCSQANLEDENYELNLESWYYGVFFRNPHKNYCANDKEYTIDILDMLNNLDTSELESIQDCLSSTITSGFLTHGDDSDPINPDDARFRFVTRSFFVNPCAVFGPFLDNGGAYTCGLSERVMTHPSFGLIEPEADDFVFTPARYQGLVLNPAAYAHDIVGKHFVFNSGSSSGDPGVNEPDPTDPGNGEITSCSSVTVTFGAVNGNQIQVNQVTFNSEEFNCNSSGSGGNTIYSCQVNRTVPFATTLNTKWSKRSGNSFIEQPSIDFTVNASNLAQPGVQSACNVSLPAPN